jgi:hypothetical protein
MSQHSLDVVSLARGLASLTDSPPRTVYLERHCVQLQRATASTCYVGSSRGPA